MKCPRCDEETPEDGLNCAACHINLYWAKYHYQALSELRAGEGLVSSGAVAPSFLVKAHDDAVAERERRPDVVAQKVRTFRRRLREDQP